MFGSITKKLEDVGFLVPDKKDTAPAAAPAQPAPAATPAVTSAAGMTMTGIPNMTGAVNENIAAVLHQVLVSPERASEDYLKFVSERAKLDQAFPGNKPVTYKGAMAAAGLDPLKLDTAMAHQLSILDQEQLRFEQEDVTSMETDIQNKDAEIQDLTAEIAKKGEELQALMTKKSEAETALQAAKMGMETQKATFTATINKVRGDVGIEKQEISVYCGTPAGGTP